MTYCTLCKKFNIPGNTRRSFHRFPRKEDIRKKWLEAIGRSTVAKTASLCSDHFEWSCYYESSLDINAAKRMLKPDAVPTIICPDDILSEDEYEAPENDPLAEHSHDLNSNDHLILNAESISSEGCPPLKVLPKETIVLNGMNPNPLNALGGLSPNSLCLNEKNELFCLNVSEILRKDPQVYLSNDKNLQKNPLDTDVDNLDLERSNIENASCQQASRIQSTKSSKENLDSSDALSNDSFHSNEGDLLIDSDQNPESHESSSSDDDDPVKKWNRRVSIDDDDDGNCLRKIIRFTNGSRLYTLSREDFVSDEAFKKFLLIHKIKTQKIEIFRQEARRGKKKIGVLKELVNTLVT